MTQHIHCLLTPLPILLLIPILLHSSKEVEPMTRNIQMAPMPSTIQRGTLHALLHTQRLSHKALHSPAFQVHLASLFTPRTAAIVGVEWGGDVRALAEAGFRVHAVEPGTAFRNSLSASIRSHSGWDVVLHAFAASNVSMNDVDVTYQSSTVASGVQARRLDDAIQEPLAVLSVDVQGMEHSVLQGATRMLGPRVASVWVEIGACNPDALRVLQTLDSEYALFDFVPWGQRRSGGGGGDDTKLDAGGNRSGEKRDGVPTAHNLLADAGNYAVDEGRPAGLEAYWEWMCERKRREFLWLQTDVLAVHRDLVGVAFRSLEKLAESTCGLPEVDCVLRKLKAAG